MARQDIKAGSAYIEIFAKTGLLRRGLRTASARLKAWGESAKQMGEIAKRVSLHVAAIGTAAAAAAGAAVRSFVRTTTELDKLSKQTGETVANLSRMQHAAKQLSIDPDDLTGAVEELNIRLGETIRDGTGPLAEAFQQLGLDARELSNVPLPERIGRIAEALNGIRSNATRGFLADEIFGGDAFKILPLIDQGADGISRLADEADRLGTTVSAGQVEVGSQLLGIWNEFMAVARASINVIGTELGKAFVALWNTVKPRMEGVREYFTNSGADMFTQTVLGAQRAFDFVAKSIDSLRISWLQLQIGVNGLIKISIDGITTMLKMIDRAVNKVGGIANAVGGAGALGGIAMLAANAAGAAGSAAGSGVDFTEAMSESLRQANEEAAAKILDIRRNAQAPAAAGGFFEDLQNNFDEVGKDMAKAELVAARRESRRRGNGRGFLGNYLGIGERIEGMMSGAPDFAKQMQDMLFPQRREGGTVGTFSANALARIGGGNDQSRKLSNIVATNERIAKATEEMKKKKGPAVG